MSKDLGHSTTYSSSSDPIVKKEKAKWNPETTKVFCEVCAKEVCGGNRPHTHFNGVGWYNVVTKFQERSGSSYDYRQLKNGLDAQKTQCNASKK